MALIEEITAFWICSFVFDSIQRNMETAAVAARWAAAKQDALRKVFGSESSEVESESNNSERDDGVCDEKQLSMVRKGPDWRIWGRGCVPCRCEGRADVRL